MMIIFIMSYAVNHENSHHKLSSQFLYLSM